MALIVDKVTRQDERKTLRAGRREEMEGRKKEEGRKSTTTRRETADSQTKNEVMVTGGKG